ncbi:MAG TPA: NAD(P)/FAD-dependent oxidoreductase [Polyangia bacterium]|nr:NAD(P)/FAD-dependent oxidoreductase [Polyangia bacterium]
MTAARVDARARDVVIIGAGHNGLVAAAYLAQAGLKPLVLERRDLIGGRAVTDEIHPGFRCPALCHSAGPLDGRIARELDLARHGLEWLAPEVRVLALAPDGHALALHDDAARTAAGLQPLSARDAAAYPEFAACFARLGAALRPLLAMTPPTAARAGARDLWKLLTLGRRLRGLGKKDLFRLLRFAPMAVADLAAEWFESELLRATIAARGIFASFAGPWSAGTGVALLLQAAHDGHATAPAAFARGGMGAISQALAASARALGAEIRTGAAVSRIAVRDGVAHGVVLASGEEIAARVVVSDADPRSTYLHLLDGACLSPDFTSKMRNYRSVGTVAKVNLALSRLPRFSALAPAGPEGARLLSGRIHIGPDIDYLERAFDAAKYGEPSAEPYLDLCIPTLLDPGLAPAGAHVMSIHAQFAPYALRSGDWAARTDALGRQVLKTLATYAPDLPELIVGAQVLTPVDLEQRYGLAGGHLLHGEAALDQLFAFRPLIGWAQYRSPIARLYLCGAGTHPGGGVTGLSGRNASREIWKDLRS